MGSRSVVRPLPTPLLKQAYAYANVDANADANAKSQQPVRAGEGKRRHLGQRRGLKDEACNRQVAHAPTDPVRSAADTH